MTDLYPRSHEISLEAALRDLGDKDPRVRAFAAGALGTTPPEDAEGARKALRETLRDGKSEVRYAAALSLGELADREAVPALIDQLEDGDAMARQAAVISLGLIGDPAAFAALAGKLAAGPPEVRFQAAVSLVQLDPAAAVTPLLAALADADPEVRGQAAAALAETGDARAAGAIAKLLADKARPARAEAALAMAKLGDARAVSVLCDLVADDEHALAALQALVPLGQASEPRIKTVCARLLGRFFGNPVLKVWAAANLAAIGDPTGEATLRKLEHHRRPDVRGSVEEARAALAGRA